VLAEHARLHGIHGYLVDIHNMDARRSAVSSACAVFFPILPRFFALLCRRLVIRLGALSNAPESRGACVRSRTKLLEILPSRMGTCAKRRATRNGGERHDLFRMWCEDNPWRSEMKFGARLAYFAFAAIVLGIAPAASAQGAGLLTSRHHGWL
jgi:hypothetical protein